MKESKTLLIKCSREENPWGGENIFEEGVTRGRVVRAEIHKMTESVSGSGINRERQRKPVIGRILREMEGDRCGPLHCPALQREDTRVTGETERGSDRDKDAE